MCITYTDVWNDFQIRQPIYLDGHFEKFKFDVVKWHDHRPLAVTDFYGNQSVSTRSCFTVGMLEYDPKDGEWSFHSCGLRYLAHRIDGLEQFLMEFTEQMENHFREKGEQ